MRKPCPVAPVLKLPSSRSYPWRKLDWLLGSSRGFTIRCEHHGCVWALTRTENHVAILSSSSSCHASTATSPTISVHRLHAFTSRGIYNRPPTPFSTSTLSFPTHSISRYYVHSKTSRIYQIDASLSGAVSRGYDSFPKPTVPW